MTRHFAKTLIFLGILSAGLSAGAAPPEVTNLRFATDPVSGEDCVIWDLGSGGGHHVYRGDLALLPGDYGACLVGSVPGNDAEVPEDPAPGQGFFYLVTAFDETGEGTAGSDSRMDPRVPSLPCKPARRIFALTPDGDGADGVEDGTDPRRNPSVLARSIRGQTAGIYLHTGESVLRSVDLAIRARSRPGGHPRSFDPESPRANAFIRFYRSQVDYDGPLGHGWDFNQNARLVPLGTDVVYHDGSGRRDVFARLDATHFDSPQGLYAVLRENSDGSFRLRYPGGTIFRFRGFDGGNLQGALLAIEDRNGNTTSFLYDHQGLLTTVVDVLGRTVELEYDSGGRLTSTTDFSGRSWVYSYDSEGHLTEVRTPVVVGTPNGNDFPDGKTTSYSYSSGFADPRLNHDLLSVTRPNEDASGPPALQVAYFDDTAAPFDRGRVESWTIGGTNATGIPAGGTSNLSYQSVNPGGDPGDPTIPRRETTVTDRNGNQTHYVHNFAGNLIQKTDFTNREVRPGEPDYVTQYEYDADGERTRAVFPEGNEIVYAYDSAGADRYRQGNLLEIRRIAGPRGDGAGGASNDLLTTYTYDPVYNLTRTITDPRGNDPSYLPQNGGAHTPERYRWERFYDHQEGDPSVTGLEAYALDWEIDTTGLQASLGDLNGDGRTDRISGNCVRRQAPTVTLDPSSRQAGIEGDTSQEIVETARYDDFGQIQGHTDAEGNLTEYTYHPENDPDGDGNPTPAPPDGRSLDPGSGGYLDSVTSDTTASADRNNKTDPTPAAVRFDLAWDALGRPTHVVDGRGVLTRRIFNELDQVVELRRAAATADRSGPAGDPATGRGETGLDALAFEVRFEYDANDNLTARRVEDRGQTRAVGPEIDTTYAYDILDRRISVTREATAASSPVTEYRYDPNENPIRVIRPEGNAHEWTYDERDLLHTATRGASGPRGGTPSVVTYDYDGNANLVRVTDPRGNLVDRAYDGHDRLVRRTDPVGNTTDHAYDPASRVVETSSRGPVAGPTPPDRSGSTNVDLARAAFLHDELNRVFRVDEDLFVPSGAPTGRTPDITEGPLVGGDGALNTIFEYDRLSRITFVRSDTTATRRLDYDGLDRLRKLTEPEQSNAEYFYDAASNVVERVETEKSSSSGPPDEEFVTTYDYDALDRLTRVVDNVGETWRAEYDALDRVTVATDARGPAGGSIHRKSPGRTGISVPINGHGNVSRYDYDGLDRLVAKERVLTPSGLGDGTTSPAPDTSNPFNADGLLRVQIDWDDNSLRTKITDDRGLETTYAYDNLDRRILTTYDDDTTTSYAYDPSHNLTRLTDANGSLHDRTYDAADRLTRIDFTGATGIEGTTVQSFEYDGLDRPTRVRDEGDPADTQDDTTDDLVYDSLGRIIEEKQSVSDGTPTKLTGRHWQSNLVSAVVYPSNRQIDYGYDAADRLVSVTDPDPQRSESASFEYFGMRRVHTRTLGNGVRSTTLDDAGTADIGYDGMRRVVNLRHLDSTNALLAGFEYEYDSMSNFVVERRRHHLTQGNPRGERYAYDSANRLVEFEEGDLDAQDQLTGPAVDAWSFVLDGAGNWPEMTRNGQTYDATPNNLNEYDEDQSGGIRVDDRVPDDFGDLASTPGTPDGVNLAHNAKGDRTVDDDVETAYDALSRAARASDGAAGVPFAGYRYDALGRRVHREVSNSGPLDETLRYTYSGSRLLEEREPSGGGGRDLVHPSWGLADTLRPTSAHERIPPHNPEWTHPRLGRTSPSLIDAAPPVLLSIDAGSEDPPGAGPPPYFLQEARFFVRRLLAGGDGFGNINQASMEFNTGIAPNGGFFNSIGERLDAAILEPPPEDGPPVFVLDNVWQVHADGTSQYLLEDGRRNKALLVDGASPNVVERITYDAWGKPQFEDPANNPRLDASGSFAASSDFGATELWRGLRYDPEYGRRTADLNTDRGGYYLRRIGNPLEPRFVYDSTLSGEEYRAASGGADDGFTLHFETIFEPVGSHGGYYDPNQGRPTTRAGITGGDSLDDGSIRGFTWLQVGDRSGFDFDQEEQETEFLLFFPAEAVLSSGDPVRDWVFGPIWSPVTDPDEDPVDEVDDFFLLVGLRNIPFIGSVSIGSTRALPAASGGPGAVELDYFGLRSNPFPFTKN